MLNQVVTDFEWAKALANNKHLGSPVHPHILNIIENGFTVINGDPDFKSLCSQAKADFLSFKQDNIGIFDEIYGENQKAYRIVNLHCKIPSLAKLFANMTLALQVLDFFLGETTAYTSLYFERGSMQDIHRDTPYFCTLPEYLYFGAWCALEDVDADNGPLQVVRGGHKLPELDRARIKQEIMGADAKVEPYSSGLWEHYQAELMAQCLQAGLKVEEVHVNHGDVIIWHPQTPHGGKQNLDPARSRHSIVFHVTPPNMPVGLQDVFYGDRTLTPGEGKRRYLNVGGRKIIAYNKVGFAHKTNFNLAELNFYDGRQKQDGWLGAIFKRVALNINRK